MSANLRLDGRVALVTGASRGIGRAVALAYARAGATVIAWARTQGALEELDDAVRAENLPPLVLIPETLTDPKKTESIAKALTARFGKLDILVGNAAILGTLTPVAHIGPKEWEEVLNTNLTANWHLLRTLDPLLQRAEAPRVIFVTSSVGKTPRAFWSTYAISKAALEMMAQIYAAEHARGPLKVTVIDPGGTRTRMRAQAYPGEPEESLPPPEHVAAAFLEAADPALAESGRRVSLKAR